MLVDGKKIADQVLAKVKTDVAKLSFTPSMAAVTCAPNFETKKYLEMKKRRAASVGISLNVLELPVETTTVEALATIERIAQECTGVVVQLPLPSHMDRDKVLTAVPAGKDPDGFLYGCEPEACLPPVVGAIDIISQQYNINWTGKRVVILGEGRLVGRPARTYAKQKTEDVVSMNHDTFDKSVLSTADIIVTGIGKARFITPDMVKPGAVVFDAGTSEDGGQLVGDVDPEVRYVSSFITPVPGGIGPITIAYLLKNLSQLAAIHEQKS